jgi:hypothetical protein
MVFSILNGGFLPLSGLSCWDLKRRLPDWDSRSKEISTAAHEKTRYLIDENRQLMRKGVVVVSARGRSRR